MTKGILMSRKAITRLFLLATVFALFGRLFIVEDYRIVSNSMFPNLKVGQLVFVAKSAFSIKLPFSSFELIKFSRPHRSEVVAFILPQKNHRTHVKRVVAVAGDRLEIKSGQLYINGNLSHYQEFKDSDRQIAGEGFKLQLEQPDGGQPYPIQMEQGKLADYGPIDVPLNHFFFLGDNRTDSIDSRTWGPVPYSYLKGKVLAQF
ncbi:MAG: signal peptidase I [Deltaproteobacteria bacterium]|nr:signal peptidase I [Deltaproteobacteria bacterium]